jgi:hypothetical protein
MSPNTEKLKRKRKESTTKKKNDLIYPVDLSPYTFPIFLL